MKHATILTVLLACAGSEPLPEPTARSQAATSPIAPPSYVDLRTFGLIPDCPSCNTTNTAAVKAALAAFSSTGAELRFPAGVTYLDEGTVLSNIAYKSSILIEGLHDFVLSGEGMYATTLMAHGTGDGLSWDILEIGKGSQRIEVRDLGFAWDTITNPPDQDHGHEIDVTANTGASNNTSYTNVHDVFFGPSIGDGYRISGTTQIVEHARLVDFVIDNGGQGNYPLGARSGVAFQRGYNDVEIGRGFIRGAKNSPVDFEPSGAIIQNGAHLHDLWIDNTAGQTCTPFSLGGTDTNTPATNGSIENVWVIEGTVNMLYMDHWTISNLHVIKTGASPNGSDCSTPMIYVHQKSTDVTFRDLDVQRLTGAVAGDLVLVDALNSTVFPKRLSFVGGTYVQQTHAIGMEIQNCDQCSLRDLTLRWEGPTPTTTHGITSRSDQLVMTDFLIDGIRITSPNGKLVNCIYLDAISNNIDSVTATNIYAPNACTSGVRLGATSTHTMDPNPILQGNDFSGAADPWTAENTAAGKVFPVIAGNKSSGARLLEGTVAPEGVTTGNQGDVYRFINSASTTSYVKVTGTGNTGWVRRDVFPTNLPITGGHYVTKGTTPGATNNCGATGGTVVGDDNSGTVTESTGATGCVVTWATTWADVPTCVLHSEAGLGLTVAVSTTGMTITNVGALAGTPIDYTCVGHL